MSKRKHNPDFPVVFLEGEDDGTISYAATVLFTSWGYYQNPILEAMPHERYEHHIHQPGLMDTCDASDGLMRLCTKCLVNCDLGGFYEHDAQTALQKLTLIDEDRFNRISSDEHLDLRESLKQESGVLAAARTLSRRLEYAEMHSTISKQKASLNYATALVGAFICFWRADEGWAAFKMHRDDAAHFAKTFFN